MWYVIQTVSGEEENIVQTIEKAVPREIYGKCFFPLCENLWKSNGLHLKIEPLFPGYIFIETEDPKCLYLHLRKVHTLSRILCDGDKQGEYVFLPLKEEEEQFLEHILDGDKENIVRRSSVWCEEKPEGGRCISRVEGPLAHYMDKLVKVDFKNRRAFIELEFLGKKRRIRLGLRLPGDEGLENRELLNLKDKEEKIGPIQKGEIRKAALRPGSRIRIVRGVYAGMETAAVSVDEKHGTLRVPVKAFGRKMQVEVMERDVELVK